MPNITRILQKTLKNKWKTNGTLPFICVRYAASVLPVTNREGQVYIRSMMGYAEAAK